MLVVGHLGVVDVGEALLIAAGTTRSQQGAVSQPETAHSCQSAKRCEMGIDLNRCIALGHRTAEEAGALIPEEDAESDWYQDEEQREPGERRQDNEQIHGSLPFDEGEWSWIVLDCIRDAESTTSQDQRDRAARILDRWDIGDPTEVLMRRAELVARLGLGRGRVGRRPRRR